MTQMLEDIAQRGKNAQRIVKSMCCAVLVEGINEACDCRDELMRAIAKYGSEKHPVAARAVANYRDAIQWFTEKYQTKGLSFFDCCNGLGWDPNIIRRGISHRLYDERWHLNMSGADFGPDKWVARESATGNGDGEVELDPHHAEGDIDRAGRFAGRPRTWSMLQETVSAGVGLSKAFFKDLIQRKLYTGEVWGMSEMGCAKRKEICYRLAEQYKCWVEIELACPPQPPPPVTEEEPRRDPPYWMMRTRRND